MIETLSLLLPEAVAALVLLVMLVREIVKGKQGKECSGYFAFLGALAVFASIIYSAPKSGSAFHGTFALDGFSTFLKGFFTLTVAAVIPMSRAYFENKGIKFGEFVLILWSSLLGLLFLASAQDLLLMFVTLEIFTLSLYVLAASLKKEMASIESGIKYMILGSLASAFVIYGIALVFMASGSTSLTAVRDYFMTHRDEKILLLGLLFIVCGFGFKVASFPFQLWVPDVYEGAPAPVAAYLTTASKTAGFALLLRVLFTAFPAFGQRYGLFAVLSALTLIYGNLGALGQTNIKRLFGYSSISHAGYLMIGLAAGKIAGVQAMIYYLTAYGFTALCAFWVVSLAGNALGSDQIEAYSGLTKRSPFLAAAFFVALFSLAGIPPMAGFFGKFLVLLTAVRSGLSWLALIGVAGVAVSIYYYLNVIRVLYFEEPREEGPIKVSALSKAVILFLIAGILAAGIWQAPFFALAGSAAKSLF